MSMQHTRSRSYASSVYSQNDDEIPIPQHFVATGCYTNKIKFSWSAVGHHPLYKSFEYEIYSEQSQGRRTRRKVTSECEAMIENLVPGQEYTFYVRAVETSASLQSKSSQPLDIKIPKDLKKINVKLNTPRAATWKYIHNGKKLLLSWKSPHHFYGDVSYELLYNDKVLGQTEHPPLILSKDEIQTNFDCTKGWFRLRSIVTTKEKYESNSIPIIYPGDIRSVNSVNSINTNNHIAELKEDDHQNNENENESEQIQKLIAEEFNAAINLSEREILKESEVIKDDSSIIYIWIVGAHNLPNVRLVAFGDPDFKSFGFKLMDEKNFIYLCSWPSCFINELNHYFLFGVDDHKINLAAMPTNDTFYKDYWKVPKKVQTKFFVVYSHKVLQRVAHAISGGVQGMHSKYRAVLKCIIKGMGVDITFKASMKTIITMHRQWVQQQQTNYAELEDVFFTRLEYYADSVEINNIDIRAMSVILLSIYWLLKTSHFKVHYRHLLHSLKGLLNIIKSDNNPYDNVIDLIVDIMGFYVIDLLKLFQSFAIEKLRKDRSRYFDLLWYQIIYLSAMKMLENKHENIDNIHHEFMSEIDQILFNPHAPSRPIGKEDLESITNIYIALLKPSIDDQEKGQFYTENGVKLEEIIQETHIKSKKIMNVISFIQQNGFSYSIFAKILYRNQRNYTFTEHVTTYDCIPDLQIANDPKSQRALLSKNGFFTFIANQKIPKEARCCVIHLIFRHFQKMEEKKLINWFKVMKKLILECKDFEVSDQILYELQQFDKKAQYKASKGHKKYLKGLHDSIRAQFEESLSIHVTYSNPILPKSFLNSSMINSEILLGLLSVLLHFRHQKFEQIDNENESDFILHLFGILMMELNELFHAEKYLGQCVMTRNNNPYGHYYADLALLKIKQSQPIKAWNYIQISLNKKHTEAYNKLILLYLHSYLVQIDVNGNVCANRYNLGIEMAANYYNGQGVKENDKKRNVILKNYYNSLICLKNEKWQESMNLIDEIYKNIHHIQLTKIKKECRDIIEQLKSMNARIERENKAMMKSIKERKRNKSQKQRYLIEQSVSHSTTVESTSHEDDYKYDEEKEESLSRIMYTSPNEEE